MNNEIDFIQYYSKTKTHTKIHILKIPHAISIRRLHQNFPHGGVPQPEASSFFSSTVLNFLTLCLSDHTFTIISSS